MMKKLLALVMVLGIASLASAGPIDIAVDAGSGYDLTTDTLEMTVGDTINLGIQRNGTVGYLAGFYYALVVENAQGTITGGSPVIYPGTNMDGIIQVNAASEPVSSYITDLAAGLGGMGYAYFNLDEYDENELEGAESVPAGLHWKDIVFTCVGPGIATINLYSASDPGTSENWTLRDTLTVTQIPEPATMALLGLGALVLRRRK
jgi:hypothetical protein